MRPGRAPRSDRGRRPCPAALVLGVRRQGEPASGSRHFAQENELEANEKLRTETRGFRERSKVS